MSGAEKDVPQPLHRWPHAGSKAGDELMHEVVRWQKHLIQSEPKPVDIAGLWIQPQQDTECSCSSITAVAIGLKAFLAALAFGQQLFVFPHHTAGDKHMGIC